MTRFLVTGASGLLGLNFALEHCENHEVVGVTNRHRLTGAPFRTLPADLLTPGEVERVLDVVEPEVVLHTAALALPDECERQPELCQRLNAWLPGQIARACRARGMRLAHISTEAVFDGLQGRYTEEDTPNPLSTYARNKLAGEEAVAAANPDALIARVVFYGWSLSGQRSLGEFFYYNLAAGRGVRGFTDAIFTPLLVNDLADILLQMTTACLTGLYHVFSREPISKYDFGVRIARRFGLDESLIAPASVWDGGLAARRSPNLSMVSEKLTRDLNITLPSQAEGIERFFQLWQTGYTARVQNLGSSGSGQ